MNIATSLALFALTAGFTLATPASTPAISGDYLEVRSCDVYTGPCFANAEMGLTGKEGILVWSVRNGVWNGTDVKGLNVIAVVRTDGTLGNLKYQPRSGKAILIVDERATPVQREALADFAKTMAGTLIKEVVDVKSAPMTVALGTCDKSGCAEVKAGSLVNISTRCMGGKDHLCGNEEVFYPPLTEVTNAYPVFTEIASYEGPGLNATWQLTLQRGAFMASFSR